MAPLAWPEVIQKVLLPRVELVYDGDYPSVVRSDTTRRWDPTLSLAVRRIRSAPFPAWVPTESVGDLRLTCVGDSRQSYGLGIAS
jgi:hypothetical protein